MKSVLASVAALGLFATMSHAESLPQAGLSYGGKVRSGPGMNYAQTGSLRQNDDLTILGRTGVLMNGYEWFSVRLTNGNTGFQWGGIMCSQHDLYGVLDKCAALQPYVGQPDTSTNGKFGAANGINVAQVLFDGGMFTWDGATSWTEGGADGNPRFQFEESDRDEWSVYLYDRSRDVKIQLDLHRGKILYGQGSSGMSDLYTITSAAAAHQ